MRSNQNQDRPKGGALENAKSRAALMGLAGSEDTQKLMAMLKRQGGVQEAAKAAAGGDPGQLMAMMNQLMNSKEGAELVARIQNQARKAGLE